MDVSHWPQDLGLMKHNMEELSNNNDTINISSRPQQLIEKRARPQKEQALNCPRCNSTNTKFCYYNNYSLTQPRYFCKTCRRYWTEGGSLRNVPVGGGSRKNKKSSSSLASSSTSSANTSTSLPTISSTTTTTTTSRIVHPKFEDGHDLNLGFPLPEFSACTTSAMDLLSSSGSGMTMSPFMPLMNSMPPLAFGVQDFRSNTLSFPLDVNINGVHNENSSGRLVFPFEESRQMNSNANGHGHEFEQQNKSEQSGGVAPNYWNGMIGGGGSW